MMSRSYFTFPPSTPRPMCLCVFDIAFGPSATIPERQSIFNYRVCAPHYVPLYSPPSSERTEVGPAFRLPKLIQTQKSCFVSAQDFDIAGSRAGELSLSLESPLGTVTSWDSHAFYRQRIGLSQMTWGVQLHCDSAHLKTSTGIVRILLVVSIIIYRAKPICLSV